ncbi:unnamed protein product, partial [marine sediment metagenome]
MPVIDLRNLPTGGPQPAQEQKRDLSNLKVVRAGEGLAPTTGARGLRGTPGSVDEISLGKKALGGLLGGLQEDPITGYLFRNIMEEFPEANQRTVESLVNKAKGSNFAKVFELVGEYAPAFATGIGAFSLGKLLAVKGIAKLGAKKGLESVLGRVAGRHLVGGPRA